jgi:hypothetical protein
MGGSRKEGWQFERVSGPEYEWYKRLFEDPDFLQRYIDRWAELRTNILATSNLLARIDQYIKAWGADAIDRNYKRWPTLDKRIFPNPTVGDTYEAEVQYLKNWITGRLAWIDTQDFPPPSIHQRPVPAQTTNALLTLRTANWSQLTMSCQIGRVYYTLDGSDPRLAGGLVSPKASEYRQPIILPPGTRLSARVKSDHDLWSAPRYLHVP